MTKKLQSPPKESIHFCRAEYSKLRGVRWKVGGAPTPTAWKSMGVFRFCDISQERLPQTFCSYVAIFWNLPVSFYCWLLLPSTFSLVYFFCSHSRFWVLGFTASAYFLIAKMYHAYSWYLSVNRTLRNKREPKCLLPNPQKTLKRLSFAKENEKGRENLSSLHLNGFPFDVSVTIIFHYIYKSFL